MPLHQYQPPQKNQLQEKKEIPKPATTSNDNVVKHEHFHYHVKIDGEKEALENEEDLENEKDSNEDKEEKLEPVIKPHSKPYYTHQLLERFGLNGYQNPRNKFAPFVSSTQSPTIHIRPQKDATIPPNSQIKITGRPHILINNYNLPITTQKPHMPTTEVTKYSLYPTSQSFYNVRPPMSDLQRGGQHENERFEGDQDNFGIQVHSNSNLKPDGSKLLGYIIKKGSSENGFWIKRRRINDEQEDQDQPVAKDLEKDDKSEEVWEKYYFPTDEDEENSSNEENEK